MIKKFWGEKKKKKKKNVGFVYYEEQASFCMVFEWKVYIQKHTSSQNVFNLPHHEQEVRAPMLCASYVNMPGFRCIGPRVCLD